MKIKVTPSKEVIERAKGLGFEEQDDSWFGEGFTIALLKTRLFNPIYYLGTATILRHKLEKNEVYALIRTGPAYSGKLIKLALKILKKRRVRFYLHFSDDKEFGVLFLGTIEGTVAIAPRVLDDSRDRDIDSLPLLSDYWRKPTSKLLRGILFGTL